MTETIGHRERLRQRFMQAGFAGFHDYEVLEFLLTFIFRQQDVKPLAKALISAFGSFSKVLDASVTDLLRVPGIGPTAAINLSAFRGVLTYYFQDATETGKYSITRMSELVQFLRAQIGHRENEVLFAIFLNASNEVLGSKELGEGTVAQAAAFPRRIVEEALLLRATSLILAHNHPGGVPEPSEADLMITQEIARALAIVDVSLQDHVILASNEYYSFNRNNLL